MSTRATYLIAANPIKPKHFVCFYIHSDNYLEGAAYYFLQMHYCKNSRGHYAGRFFRSNEYAEFAYSHNSHGDTEYRYHLNAQGQLTVWSIDTRNKWVKIYRGFWHEFVNQQLPEEETLYLFEIAKFEGGRILKKVMTLTEAKHHINNEEILAKEALDRGAVNNARCHEYEAKFLQIQVDAILAATPFNES